MVSGIGSVGSQASYAQATTRATSVKEMFSRADANGDGQLSLEELDTMMQQGPPQGAPPTGAPPTGAPPVGGPPSATELIERFDSDGDGLLSEEEAVSMMEALRAEMEEMMARFTVESSGSESSEQESDYASESSAYLTAALQSYTAGAAESLTESRFSTVG